MDSIFKLFENIKIDDMPIIYKNNFKNSYGGFSKHIDLSSIPSIPLLIPYLYLDFPPIAEIHFYVYIKSQNDFDLNEEQSENLIYIDLFTGGSFSVSTDASFLFNLGLVSLGFSVRLNGVLGVGDLGMKLNLEFKKDELTFDIYFVFLPYKLNFYIAFRIEINLVFKTFVLISNLKNNELIGFKDEEHTLGSIRPNQTMITNSAKKNMLI